MRSQVGRKASIIRKSLASACMNENRPRQRQRLDPIKGIVGKQNSPVLAKLKIAQTVAAGTVSGSDFSVSGVAVTWRAHRGPDEIGDLGWNGGDAEGMWHRALASDLLHEIRREGEPVAIRSLRPKRKASVFLLSLARPQESGWKLSWSGHPASYRERPELVDRNTSACGLWA
jgi:hypothetical protein